MIKECAQWLKTNAAFLLLLVIGAFTGAALLRSKQSRINTIEAALEVERRKKKVVELSAQRMALRPVDEEKANAILRLSAEMAKHNKRIVELHSGQSWEQLPGEDIRRALRDVGL